MNIKVSVDSTCDLGEALMNQYDITPLALTVNMRGKNYKDMANIMPEDIYEYVDAGGDLPKTSAVNSEEYRNAFTLFLKSHDAVIHISLSSDMSSCYQNACNAASGLNVFVIDSRNLSTGSGHLALIACELAKQGMEAEKIAEVLNDTAKRVETSFVASRLDYLHKGGRCSAVAMLGANILKIKPGIEVTDGVMGMGKKYRGTLERCLKQYVKDRLEGRTDIDTKRIFITHSSIEQKYVDMLKEEVEKYMKFDEVLVTRASCTISSHCGDNCLGILYIRKGE